MIRGLTGFFDSLSRKCRVALRCFRPCLAAALGVMFAAMLGGCAGYHLGPSNGLEAGEQTLQIHPFLNQTMEPRLGDAVTMALRKDIQQDGTYRLATHGGADIVVTGTLLRFDRRELSLLPNDVLTARDFRLNVSARVTARQTSTGKIILDRVVTGYTLMRVGSDMSAAERQALPLLGEDLARNITSLLVDGTW